MLMVCLELAGAVCLDLRGASLKLGNCAVPCVAGVLRRWLERELITPCRKSTTKTNQLLGKQNLHGNDYDNTKCSVTILVSRYKNANHKRHAKSLLIVVW